MLFRKEVVVKEEEVIVDGDNKKCPKCGEMIPKDWITHKFKSDGSKCGYNFEEG